jgi:homoserine dehydrogenase
MSNQTPDMHRIMILGFGNVARGLCEVLHKKKQELLDQHHFDFKIIAVVTRSRGSMHNPEGIPTSLLLDLAKSSKPFTHYREEWDAETAIRLVEATVVVDLTPTNIQTGEPALSYCKSALESGKHVVSGNKGPAAVAYDLILSLANQAGRRYLHEATVLSGTPVFSFAKRSLPCNQIEKIRGILNGSTNFILSEMEKGSSYDEAKIDAKNQGYLEAEHSADIDGFDAVAKVVILSKALLAAEIMMQDVERVGITEINEDIVRAATAEGKRWKLIATIQRSGEHFTARVKPEKLDMNDPLANVMGTANSLTFTTDLLNEITISGPGAGPTETGYAILSDLLTINSEVASWA